MRVQEISKFRHYWNKTKAWFKSLVSRPKSVPPEVANARSHHFACAVEQRDAFIKAHDPSFIPTKPGEEVMIRTTRRF